MTDTTAVPRVPTHIPSLARAIVRMKPGHGGDADLWDRLVAQEGTEEAMRLWRAACSHLDQTAAAEDEAMTTEQAIREAYQAGRRAQEDNWLEEVETEQEVVDRLLAKVAAS